MIGNFPVCAVLLHHHIKLFCVFILPARLARGDIEKFVELNLKATGRAEIINIYHIDFFLHRFTSTIYVLSAIIPYLFVKFYKIA